MQDESLNINCLEMLIEKLSRKLFRLKNNQEPTDGRRLLKEHEVLEALDISHLSFRAGIESGRYPEPIKWAGALEFWREQEVMDILESREEKTNTSAKSRSEDPYGDISDLVQSYDLDTSEIISALSSVLANELGGLISIDIDEQFFERNIYDFASKSMLLNCIPTDSMYKC